MHIIHSRDESVIKCTSGDLLKNVDNLKISVSRYERISHDNYINLTVDSGVIKHSVCWLIKLRSRYLFIRNVLAIYFGCLFYVFRAKDKGWNS